MIFPKDLGLVMPVYADLNLIANMRRNALGKMAG